MNVQDRIKIFNRDLARNAMYASSWLITRLPYGAVRMFTRFFTAVGYVLVVRHKRMARESLRIAFGQEKGPAEIEKIIRKCFENIGQMMVELMYFMAHPEMIGRHVTIQGREHLDKALAEGNGVIAVSAHFGNFPLMLLWFAQQGYKTNAIIRPARDQQIEKYFLEKRSSLGLNTIYAHPRKACVDSTIKALRNNEFVFIPLDQNFGNGAGVFVEFFGQKAATATGPVVFARRTKAPILPVFVIREKDDIHKIIIEPPMALEERATDEESIYASVVKITQLIEQYIRKYPHEWGWMHRRWKSRPAGEEPRPAAASEAVV